MSVVGTALDVCEPLSCYSVIPVMVTEKIKYQCSESLQYPLITVPSCFVELFHTAQELVLKVMVGRSHSSAVQLQIVQSLNHTHGWSSLLPERAVSRMTHFLRDCSRQGPGLTVVFGAAGFVYCGFSRGSACVTP